jgi:uncharacterized integral membrane protein (TIGR00698 family)
MANKTTMRPSTESAKVTPQPAAALPGLAATGLGVALALLAHRLFAQVGVLTWAVVLGAVAANLNLLPAATRPGLRLVTRRLLRVGVALLGFSLPVAAIMALGLPMIGLVVVTLITTLLATTWLGVRMGLGRPRSLLIGTGFAICGASAIAAMEENAEADEDDVAMAVAMVTLCGTVAMIALPLLQTPLGLSDAQLGAWAGAGVHEVGQVVAAAGPAGGAAVSIAIVVKLTRVLLLAPVVAGVSVQRRRRSRLSGREGIAIKRPPLIPLFVLAFLGCVTLRSVGVIPGAALGPIAQVQTITLSAALFGMGTAVHLRSILRGSGSVLLLATVSTLVVGGISLGGVLLLV